MSTTSEVKEILEVNKPAKKRCTIHWSDRAADNLDKQRKAYMKKYGKAISKRDLACKLLETAKVI